MAEHSEQQRLLVHDTVASTVDTILAAIQQEIARAQQRLGEDPGTTRASVAAREGVIEGLRIAEGAAAVASVAARSAALHSTRPVEQAAA